MLLTSIISLAAYARRRRQVHAYQQLAVQELQEAREAIDRTVDDKVQSRLYSLATTSNNVGASIFWMKARRGWKDRAEVDHKIKHDFTPPKASRSKDRGQEELEALLTEVTGDGGVPPNGGGVDGDGGPGDA